MAAERAERVMRWPGAGRWVTATAIAAALTSTLVVLTAAPAGAQQDPAEVAGSYVIRTFDPGQTGSGPDVATCWGTLAVGDTVTVAAVGSGLTVTLPAGWWWQLEADPTPQYDPATVSAWRGTDEDR